MPIFVMFDNNKKKSRVVKSGDHTGHYLSTSDQQTMLIEI